jgi:hypothetical protein
MSRTIQIIAAVVLGLHGLVHLLGPAVYMAITGIEGFSYKTTLLAGHWYVGENGIRIFSALWILPAVGFIITAIALLIGWEWWRSGLAAVTLFSMVLTVLDLSVAYAGVAITAVILAILYLSPRMATWF